MSFGLISAAPGFNHIIALADGTYHRIPIIAWRMSIGPNEELGSVDYITADMDRDEEAVAVEYPTGTVERVEDGKLFTNYQMFLASRRAAHSGMTRSEAIAFLMLVKNETASRDYGPGLSKVIDLIGAL